MSRRPSGPGHPAPLSTALPTYLTRLVGREREIGEVTGLLRSHRLVSLVGPGGSGKTRLAVAVAEAIGSRHTAVAWIDLAPLSDAALLPAHVATTLGIREQGGRAVLEALGERIGRRSLLLVLDNCEHLVGAAAALAAALLAACPGLRVLTTSRQALGLTGERAWVVRTLDVPESARDAVASPAVRLFVDRASDVLPGFALDAGNVEAVLRICRRVDGLPLGLELAAARVRHLPPEQLADRLEEAFQLLASGPGTSPPRHRTLRALIDWSFDLLGPGERVLFERLAVFSGGFTLEAVEAVAADARLDGASVLELVAALVDRSLVGVRDDRGRARYELLETIRRHAAERLGRSGGGGADDEAHPGLRGRHASFYAGLAEGAARRLRGPERSEWLACLGLEHDNLRAALAHATATADGALALRLCVALQDFWTGKGHVAEGRRWTEEALRLPGQPEALRARGLVCQAVLARMQGEHGVFGEGLREAEALARRSGDAEALAHSLTRLGLELRERRELTEAGERLDEAIAVWRELDHARGLAQALGVRASVALAEGDVPLARRLREESVELAGRARDADAQAQALLGLGEVARLEGELEGSRRLNERALAHFEAVGDAWHAAAAHQNLGWLAAESGSLHEAFRAFRACGALFRGIGRPYGLALTLHGLAHLLHRTGEHRAAATCLAGALAYAERMGGVPAAPADVAACERTRTLVEASLAGEALERARAEGRTMELGDCLDWAEARLLAVLPEDASPVVTEACPPTGDAAEPMAGAEPDLRVRTLGALEIRLGDRPLEGDAFGSSKPKELLLQLLCHPAGRTAEQMGLAFWPDATEDQVRNRFHVTLHRLRAALGRGDWISRAGDAYRLDPGVVVDFDAAVFEREVTGALGAPGPDADRLPRLSAALARYGGDFLEAEPVGDWHLEVRDRLRALYLRGRMEEGRILEAAERWDEAGQAFRSVLARDRLHEEACRRLMVCQARTGRRAAALRLYRDLSLLLREELQTEPEPATRELYEALRRSPVSPV